MSSKTPSGDREAFPRDLSRRRFLKLGLGAAAGVGLAASGLGSVLTRRVQAANTWTTERTWSGGAFGSHVIKTGGMNPSLAKYGVDTGGNDRFFFTMWQPSLPKLSLVKVTSDQSPTIVSFLEPSNPRGFTGAVAVPDGVIWGYWYINPADGTRRWFILHWDNGFTSTPWDSRVIYGTALTFQELWSIGYAPGSGNLYLWQKTSTTNQQMLGFPYAPPTFDTTPRINVSVSNNIGTSGRSLWSEIGDNFWNSVDFVQAGQIFQANGSTVTRFTLPSSTYVPGAVVKQHDGKKYSACAVAGSSSRWVVQDPSPATTFSDAETISPGVVGPYSVPAGQKYVWTMRSGMPAWERWLGLGEGYEAPVNGPQGVSVMHTAAFPITQEIWALSGNANDGDLKRGPYTDP